MDGEVIGRVFEPRCEHGIHKIFCRICTPIAPAMRFLPVSTCQHCGLEWPRHKISCQRIIGFMRQTTPENPQTPDCKTGRSVHYTHEPDGTWTCTMKSEDGTTAVLKGFATREAAKESAFVFIYGNRFHA